MRGTNGRPGRRSQKKVIQQDVKRQDMREITKRKSESKPRRHAARPDHQASIDQATGQADDMHGVSWPHADPRTHSFKLRLKRERKQGR